MAEPDSVRRPAQWVLRCPDPGGVAAWPQTGRSSAAVIGLDRAPRHTGIASAGIDLVDTRRFALAVSRSGPGFVRRLFGPAERAALPSGSTAGGAEHLAAAFGLKESVVKLIGGLPPGASFSDIVTSPLTSGAVTRPSLGGVLAGWADQYDVDLVGGVKPVGDGLVLAWTFALTRARAR